MQAFVKERMEKIQAQKEKVEQLRAEKLAKGETLDETQLEDEDLKAYEIEKKAN